MLIFGRSLFLNEIDINRLLNLGYTTIGINTQTFITDYVAFLDDRIFKVSNNFKGICLTRPKYFGQVREPVIYFDNNTWNFTHDFVLSWLKEQNVEEVILIGCADFIDNKYYHTDDLHFTPTENSTRNSINFIENEASKWFKLYKLNPQGILNIPVKEL